MEKHEVYVVGSGKLAAELLIGLGGNAVSGVTSWNDPIRPGFKKGIVVHAGSGRELGDVIEFCEKTNSVLLELSTSGAEIPESVTFPVVHCPNVNLLILEFMAMIKTSGGNFREYEIRITESHQSSKSSKPGTAIYLANALGLSEKDIRSVRDPDVQQSQIGIPREHLERHAYHKIEISNQEAVVTLEARVLGRAAYAASLGKIIDRICFTDLSPGHHDIVKLLTAVQNRKNEEQLLRHEQ